MGAQIRRCGVCVLELETGTPPLRVTKNVLGILKSGKRFFDVDLTFESKKIESWSHSVGPHSLQTLAKSAKRGCTGCQCLQELLFRNVTDAKLLGLKHLEIDWRQSKSTSKNYISLRIKEASEDILSFEIFTPNQALVDNDFIKCAPEIEDTALPATLLRLNLWLEQCNTSHPQCGSGKVVELPKRVLEITQENDAYRLRLIEPHGVSGRYACLSHCWGKSSYACVTIMENLHQNKQDIPWLTLPRTFQEAVVMTSRLEIKFLWIDSICIIQDDRNDWLREGGKMDSIYRNAFVTLAATKSSDSSGGLFSKVPKRYEAVKIPRNGPELSIFIRECLPHPEYNISNYSKTFLYKDLDGKQSYATIGGVNPEKIFEAAFPLLTRAWVYQERLLSPRVIHFASAEIFFECFSHTFCECHPPDTAITAIKSRHHESLHPELASEMQLEFDQRWRELVVSYTGLQLTFEDDKLTALSGLAKQFADNHPGELGRYLAGLWENTIHRDLLWFCCDQTKAQPHNWRGPSWSWTSTNSQIGYYYFDNKPWLGASFSLVDAVTEGNEFGICKSVNLVVSAYLVPGVLKRVDDVYLMRVDNHAPQSRREKGFHLAIVISPDHRLDEPGENYLAENTAIFCIKRDEMGESLRNCLVIVPVAGEEGSFRRIGITGEKDFRAANSDERWTKHAAMKTFRFI